jgi:hypothetical protein
MDEKQVVITVSKDDTAKLWAAVSARREAENLSIESVPSESSLSLSLSQTRQRAENQERKGKQNCSFHEEKIRWTTLHSLDPFSSSPLGLDHVIIGGKGEGVDWEWSSSVLWELTVTLFFFFLSSNQPRLPVRPALPDANRKGELSMYNTAFVSVTQRELL